MRHRLGNTPKCCECYWYREKEAHEKTNQKDGWCTNKKQLARGINGRKRERPPEREPRLWNSCCSLWEDAELRLRESLKGPCKFYKPREQYRQEIREAEARALKNVGTGIRTHGKIEWSEDAHHEREKGKDIP